MEAFTLLGKNPRFYAAFGTIFWLLLLTDLVILIHGYHFGIEDQAIYLPAIEKNMNPALFARDAEMFLPQTRPTLFDEFVALMPGKSRLALERWIFFWHEISVLLILWGALRLARRYFPSPQEHWAAVTMLAVLLTLPVTGTGLYIVDQYLHPRAMATACLLFMLVDVLDGKLVRAALWIVPAALMHIQMAFYGVLLGIFFLLPDSWLRKNPLRRGKGLTAGMLVIPLSTLFEPGSPAWLEAARTRSTHYLLRWPWYEWLGIFGPLALLWWFSRIAERNQWPALRSICLRLVIFGTLVFVVAAILTIPPQLERLTPYQPMRGFHLLYLIFVLFAGGLLGKFFLQKKTLRWILVFAPLSCAMFFAQRQLFPSTAHIELPGNATRNDWLRAFAWVRQNTPQDAYFALDPYYMERPGEDEHGFRGLAQRSMMADYIKDSGVVLLFPAIAEPWHREASARAGWKDFRRSDFERLQHDFGVNWVILENSQSAVKDLPCPYQNKTVRVCQVD